MDRTRIQQVVAVGLGLGTVVLVALLAGVGSGALTDEPTPEEVDFYASIGTTTTTAGGSAAGTANLVVTGVDFSAGTVQITNIGDGAGTLDGLWLCNFPSYTPISGSVEAGGSIDVAFGVPADDGEVGLYTSRSFGDASAIISYVEWGNPGHERADVAVDAGVWDGEAVAGGGTRLVASVSAPRAAADWTTE